MPPTMKVELPHITTTQFADICRELGFRVTDLTQNTVYGFGKHIMASYDSDFWLWLFGPDNKQLEEIKQAMLAAATQKSAESQEQERQSQPEQPSLWV